LLSLRIKCLGVQPVFGDDEPLSSHACKNLHERKGFLHGGNCISQLFSDISLIPFRSCIEKLDINF